MYEPTRICIHLPFSGLRKWWRSRSRSWSSLLCARFGSREGIRSMDGKLPLFSVHRLSASLRFDELGWDILSIAFPAAVGLVADPLSSLVDTIFLGRIGSVELAAVGVSISIFNLVSKLFNLPLLNITTSFVAEDNALGPHAHSTEAAFAEAGSFDAQETETDPCGDVLVQKHELPAVSASLALGLALGLFEAAFLIIGSSPVLSLMGVHASSDMRVAAQQYLIVRSLAAPAVVLSLAVQGAFRGFKDTRTPLYATVAGSVAHVILDPVLMFTLHYGVYGAAVATVISEYLMVGVLLWKLSKFVTLLPTQASDLSLLRFLTSGGLLLIRTTATLLTMTLATSMAARLGSTSMAAHQICVQIWLAASLLSDSLALAGQALIADGMATQEHEQVKAVAHRVLQMSLGLGIAMATVLGLGITTGLPRLFTSDTQVLNILSRIIPFVIATQPINAMAFAFDGLYYGASDFVFSAYTACIVALVSSASLYIGASMWGLSGIWTGLTMFMSLRACVGFIRLGTASGPWKFLKRPDCSSTQTSFSSPATSPRSSTFEMK